MGINGMRNPDCASLGGRHACWVEVIIALTEIVRAGKAKHASFDDNLQRGGRESHASVDQRSVCQGQSKPGSLHLHLSLTRPGVSYTLTSVFQTVQTGPADMKHVCQLPEQRLHRFLPV
jgi:hypothetical protein